MAKPGECLECGAAFDVKAKVMHWSPYFCGPCDEVRIARITRQLRELGEKMGAK